MMVLGCDPGLTGALALICGSKGLLELADLPTCDNGLETGSMKRWLDAGALADLVQDWSFRHDFAHDDLHCVVERPIAMPSASTDAKGKKRFGVPAQTVAGQFDCFGAVRMLMAIRSKHFVHSPAPKTWQKPYGLSGGDKQASMECALRLYPQAPIVLKKHHNRAEALLIAHWLAIVVN